MSRSTTGNPTAYTPSTAQSLLTWLMAAFAAWAGNIGQMAVTADVEWAGTYNLRPHRTTTLGPLDLAATRAAVEAARQASMAAERVYAQRPARGWSAQIRELTRTKAGYAAADRAGLNVNQRTLLAWLADERTPSKANQARIEQAAISLQYERAAQARTRAQSAAMGAADALSAAIERRYGTEVRLFNISNLYFHD